jgi:hypothetical protein
MTLKAALQQIPAHREIITRNQIEALAKGLDLAIKDGDLALTRRGELMLGDKTSHAFFDLVRDWRYNYAPMKVAFDLVAEAGAHGKELETEREALCSGPELLAERFRGIQDELAIMAFARGSYSALAVLNVSNALQTFRADIGANQNEWAAAQPQFNGRSFGEILEASANNIRHRDEWAATNPPTPTQLKSIKVLADALNEPVAPAGRKHGFAREIGPETLALVCDRDFSRLETNFFAFAKNLYAQRQLRLDL